MLSGEKGGIWGGGAEAGSGGLSTSTPTQGSNLCLLSRGVSCTAGGFFITEPWGKPYSGDMLSIYSEAETTRLLLGSWSGEQDMGEGIVGNMVISGRKP